jgi:phosphatidyl-N-methylethanolamine N-methyltransferase
MSVVVLAIAAALLSVERACYVAITRAPDGFRALCARPMLARRGGPIAIVAMLFCVFKALQLGVFVAWCWVHGDGDLVPAHGNPLVFGLAAALVLVGQTFNVAVFCRLGRIGVFFGDRLGYVVRRCQEFPFSVLSHPQYVGSLLTIWGFFLAARFPHDDWYALPVLETAYYATGAWLESQPLPAQGLRKRMSPTNASALDRVSLESIATDTARSSSAGSSPKIRL